MYLPLWLYKLHPLWKQIALMLSQFGKWETGDQEGDGRFLMDLGSITTFSSISRIYQIYWKSSPRNSSVWMPLAVTSPCLSSLILRVPLEAESLAGTENMGSVLCPEPGTAGSQKLFAGSRGYQAAWAFISVTHRGTPGFELWLPGTIQVLLERW